MSISRVNVPGWGIGDEVTSAQMNGVDTNATYALDKRSGQTDTLESIVTLTGAGRLIPTVATGADANTTYQPGGGNLLIRVTSAVTANRNYTLGTTGVQAGDSITILAEASFVTYEITVKDQAAATIFTLGNLNTSDGQWASFVYTGSAWRLFKSPASRLRTQTFASNGTFTVPPGVTELILIGYGGGGGGGGGASGPNATDGVANGGGGGGGALLSIVRMGVTPGDAHSVTLGVGGTGGIAGIDGVTGGDGSGGSGFKGNDGSNTVFSASPQFKFQGAGGGGPGVQTDFAQVGIVFGGGPTALATNTDLFLNSSTATNVALLTAMLKQSGYASKGGATESNGSTAHSGFSSPQGHFGGAGAAAAAHSGSYRGGRGGAGGGGGPGAAGGAGGAGGAGNNAGQGAAGAAGTAAAANSGAGGGGGGGSGAGSTTHRDGAAGGAGGSGQLTVCWVR